jgi:hypothetical protein
MGQSSGLSASDVSTLDFMYPAPLASISGPTSITQAGTYTWTANPSGGTGTYTYAWEAYDGHFWYAKGSAQSWSGYFDWNTGAFKKLRVTVTSGGRTTVTTINVSVSIPQPPPSVYISGVSNVTVKGTYAFTANYSNVPNPTFTWYERDCSTVQGTLSCGAWSPPGYNIGQSYNRVLTPYDCPSGPITWELRVVVGGRSDGLTAEGTHSVNLCKGGMPIQ